MVQESQKRAARKWDGENMSTLGCKVKKPQAESFKEYCAGQGKTSNAVLRDYVLNCIGEPDGAQVCHQEYEGQLSTSTLEAAQRAIEATGEALEQFVERAVETQAKRDMTSLRLGINPATGERLAKAPERPQESD